MVPMTREQGRPRGLSAVAHGVKTYDLLGKFTSFDPAPPSPGVFFLGFKSPGWDRNAPNAGKKKRENCLEPFQGGPEGRPPLSEKPGWDRPPPSAVPAPLGRGPLGQGPCPRNPETRVSAPPPNRQPSPRPLRRNGGSGQWPEGGRGGSGFPPSVKLLAPLGRGLQRKDQGFLPVPAPGVWGGRGPGGET